MSEQHTAITPAEERYWNRYRLVQTLQSLAALWMAMALIALVMGAAGYRRALAQAEWPAVPGTITTSEVINTFLTSPASPPAQVVRIIYAYAAGGTNYTSDQVNLNPVPVLSGSAEGQRLLATYPAGAAVTVYHDPADPAAAVLEREPSPVGFYAGLALLGMAVVVGLAGFVLGRGLRKPSD